jgi:hypothetical protein
VTLAGIVEAYLAGVGGTLYAAVQRVSDLAPFSLNDAAVLCLLAACGLAWRTAGSGRWRRLRYIGAAAALACGWIALVHAALPYARPRLEERWRFVRADQLDAESYRLDALREAHGLHHLYRSEYPLPERARVAAAVRRVLAEHGEATMPSNGRSKASLLVGTGMRLGWAEGFVNPLLLWSESNLRHETGFLSLATIAHEEAHKQLNAREDEAQLVAYLALAGDPHPLMRAAAHLMRAEASAAAYMATSGLPLALPLPPTVQEEKLARQRGRRSQLAGEIYGFFLAGSGQGERPYSDGFLSLLHGYEAHRVPTQTVSLPAARHSASLAAPA